MAKILVVDDEQIVRRLITLALTNEGHVIVEATNGREAAAKLAAEPFDLLITDILMPETDGLEMIMNVQRDDKRLPVIAMTGMHAQSPLYLKIATSLGAWRTLQKPFSPLELIEVAHAVLHEAGHDI